MVGNIRYMLRSPIHPQVVGWFEKKMTAQEKVLVLRIRASFEVRTKVSSLFPVLMAVRYSGDEVACYSCVDIVMGEIR